jgi:hypothetical protein
MDPAAITYAQVPSRIIYLPGDQGIFARKSATQTVAYNLVPVDRIPAIQAEGTPEFGQIQGKREDGTKSLDIVETSFLEEDGSTIKGTGRRLGVLGQNEVEKERASNLLKRGEELRWSADIGWLGFIPDKKANAYTPKKEKEKDIPPIETPTEETKKKPEIEQISTKLDSWGSDDSSKKKEETPQTSDEVTSVPKEEEISLDITEKKGEDSETLDLKIN